MNDHPSGVTDLLQRATDDLEVPASQLVAGGVTRGRALRRRQRIGTAVAAAAVFGVIGATAAVVPSLLDGEGRASDAGFARQRGAGETTPAVPEGTRSGDDVGETDPTVTPRAGAPALTVAAADIPAAVETVLGSDDAGDPLAVPPYPLEDGPHEKIVHFLWKGMLATVIIEPVAISDSADCANVKVDQGECTPLGGGRLATYWGPDTADGVTAHGVVVWSGRGHRVSVLTYNASAGKDVAPLQPAPGMTRAEMETIAASDVWFA